MKITPLHNRVVVRQAQAEAPKSSLIIIVGDTTPPCEGTILAVGPEVMQLKVGDYVFYPKWTDVKLAPDILVMKETDILGVRDDSQMLHD